MTRGGARSGAGRKSALSTFEALQLGEWCEYQWSKTAEDQALERHTKSTRTTLQIRDVQDSAALVGRLARKHGMPEQITEDIDHLTGGDRVVSIPLKRPYGAKAKVIAAAIKWCKAEYGQTITVSKATECWKAYKRFQRRAHGELSHRSEK
jgi:hypothetical protein